MGENGTIVVSTDNGAHWTAKDSSGNYDFRGVGFGSGTFVAVGANGHVMWSSDGGNNWFGTEAPDTSAILYNVAYGGGAFITATDQQGKFYASTDNGQTWSVRSTGTQVIFDDITYGNGKFTAVGGGGYTIWSSDGTTWHTAPTATNRFFYGVTYGVGTAGPMFVAVGDSRTIFRSPDAAVWIESSGVSQPLYGITNGNSMFVAVGPSNVTLTPPTGITTSADGIAWSGISSMTGQPAGVPTFDLKGVAYGAGTFVAVGQSGYIYSSTDGSNWTFRNSGAAGSSYHLYDVAYGGSVFVAVGKFDMIYTSSNGASWTSPSQAYQTQDLRGVAYGGSAFVAVGTQGLIQTSTNGTSWAVSRIPSLTNNDLNGVACGNVSSVPTFVAVGAAGTVLTSTNGTSWSAYTVSGAPDLRGVTYGNNTFLAVGASGVVYSSPTGSTWTQRTSATSMTGYRAAWGSDTFVAAGDFGIIQSASVDMNITGGAFSQWSETDTIGSIPSGYTVSRVISYTASVPSGSADFSFTFPSLPSSPAFYKVVGGQWIQLAACTGVTNIITTGTTLSFTMAASSNCNAISSTTSIVDPLVLASGSSSGGGGGSGGGAGGSFPAEGLRRPPRQAAEGAGIHASSRLRLTAHTSIPM